VSCEIQSNPYQRTHIRREAIFNNDFEILAKNEIYLLYFQVELKLPIEVKAGYVGKDTGAIKEIKRYNDLLAYTLV